ncbi:MAG: flagellar M-ring protein FliF [Firmicutes bacterium]|nr:flagellar M-ring protein FliF [Bacillota bacterium]
MTPAAEAVRKAFGGWTRPQAVLAAGLGAAALLAVGAWLWLRGADGAMQPLFTNLQPADAAAVVQVLEGEHVPYKLDDNGATILVPAADVYRLRLELASQGLPASGSVGFEVMDKLGLAATDFDRQVALLRATQGELERTIEQIQGVARARVHIVMPKDTVFAGESQPASAAVLVEMKPGETLEARTVQGIVHLVAASVPNLSPDQVTVLDQTGRILSSAAAAADDTAGGAQDNMAVQARFQADLQSRLQDLLTQIFGPGNVVAQVSAELNFDRTTTVSDLFTAPTDQGGLLRSITELRRSVQGQSTAAGGVPGDSNFPTYPATTGGNQTSSTTEDQSTRNYELNETKTTTQVAPGSVKRLSVAVVVNKPLDAQQQQQVEQLVAAAIGADPARQDTISVTSMPFDRSLLQALQPSETTPPTGRAVPLWAWAAAGAAVVLLAAVWIVLAGRRRAARRRAEEEALALARLEAQRAAEEQGTPAANGTIHDLKTYSRERPEQVARALRVWLAED